MGRKKIWMAFLIFAFLSTLVLAETVDLKAMREYFKSKIANGPYIYQQSPRTGLGVGTIYTVADGKTIFYSRPDECFSRDFLEGIQKNADQMAVENFNQVGKYNLQLGLNIANAGPVTPDVQAELTRKHAASIVLNVPYLKRQVMTIAQLKDAIHHSMDVGCKDAFTSLKPERWIVLETLYSDKYSVKFEDSASNDISISAKVIKTIFPSFKLNTDADITGTLSFDNQNYIVAVKAIKIKDITKFAGGDQEFTTVDPMSYYLIQDKR
jgi:hypothetical protein